MPLNVDKLNRNSCGNPQGFAPSPKSEQPAPQVSQTPSTTDLIRTGQQLNSGAIINRSDRAHQYLDRVEVQRDEALEDLTDRAAYLLSEDVFWAEFFDRTAVKLGKQEDVSLENPYDGFKRTSRSQGVTARLKARQGQQFSLWKFCLSLLRIISIASLESPIPSFKIWQFGQVAGQNENCWELEQLFLSVSDDEGAIGFHGLR